MNSLGSLTGPTSETAAAWLRRSADLAVLLVMLSCSAAILANPYRYYQDDALFYLQIARSVADGAGPTFFPGLPTNGFHAFWLLVCSAISSGFDTHETVGKAIAATMVLLNGGAALIIRFGLRRFLPAAALSAGLLVSLPYMVFGGVGMESSLVSFLYAGFIVRVVHHLERPSNKGLVQCAALAGLSVFARLDLAIGLMPTILLVLAHLLRQRRAMERRVLWTALALLVGSLPVLVWLWFNVRYFGDAIPISGKLKLAAGLGGGMVVSGGPRAYLAIAAIAAILLPAFNRSRACQVVSAVCAGQCLYFVYLLTAGYPEVYAWYFVPLALAAGLGVAALITTIAKSDTFARLSGQSVCHAVLVVLMLALVISTAAKVYGYIRRPGFQSDDYKGPMSLGAVAARYGVHRVLAFDRPGQLAYFDGLGTLAVDGLTTNLEFQRNLRARGIDWAIRTYRIDGFVGPSFEGGWGDVLCGKMHLGSTRYFCDDARTRFIRVEFLSRLDGHKIGEIDLDAARRLEFRPDRTLALYALPRR